REEEKRKEDDVLFEPPYSNEVVIVDCDEEDADQVLSDSTQSLKDRKADKKLPKYTPLSLFIEEHKRVSLRNGRQVTINLTNLGAELSCPICLDILKNSLISKNCGHRFCLSCLMTETCPVCSCSLTSTNMECDREFDKFVQTICTRRRTMNGGPPSAPPFSACDAPIQNQHNPTLNSDPFSATSMYSTNGHSAQRATTKTLELFLGDDSSDVNLDNLMGGAAHSPTTAKPFLLTSTSPLPVNHFTAKQRKSAILNEKSAGDYDAPSLGEEEMEPQIALALSKKDHERQEEKRKGD
ncbi:hypothetical protein PFISCL1PPCAC_27772, partial [Pristionchus fissidentatus]